MEQCVIVYFRCSFCNIFVHLCIVCVCVCQDMVRRGEILDDSMEDEFYLRRLDAGLFVLQLICYIMVEISNAGVPQVHTHTHTLPSFAHHICRWFSVLYTHL